MPSRNVTDTDDKLVMAEKVLSSLANLDAMKIFNEALNGIESSTKTIKKLGLSQKRYYTRLNELIEAGLIQKNGEVYELTMLGKLCYKIEEMFIEVLGKYDRIVLMERLRRSKNLSLEEVETISRILAKDVVDTFNVAYILEFVRVADTWEKVVEYTTEYLDRAEESIYFATKYFEVRTVEALIRALNRGVKFQSIIDASFSSSMKEKIKFLRSMIMHPRVLKDFYNFTKIAKEVTRYAELPYTFFIVDEKYVMIEIANPIKNTFNVAFFFHSEKVAKRLLNNFRMLWERGSLLEYDIKEISAETPI